MNVYSVKIWVCFAIMGKVIFDTKGKSKKCTTGLIFIESLWLIGYLSLILLGLNSCCYSLFLFDGCYLKNQWY